MIMHWKTILRNGLPYLPTYFSHLSQHLIPENRLSDLGNRADLRV